MLFLRVFEHLLPRGAAWKITIEKTLRRFFLGLTEQPQATRTFADTVYLDMFPATARSQDEIGGSGALEEWEKQYGLVPASLVDFATRRTALDAEVKANGGQSPGYIQGILRAAGFNVYVHEWFEPGGPPYVARDPRLYTTNPQVGLYQCTGEDPPGTPLPSQPQCSAFASQPQCNNFLANEIGYLVNKDLTRRSPPPIPDDPTKFPYFIYIGGETFPARATVNVTRRAELERLILKLRPNQNWVVVMVDYIAVGSITTESGDFIITEDGDLITAES